MRTRKFSELEAKMSPEARAETIAFLRRLWLKCRLAICGMPGV